MWSEDAVKKGKKGSDDEGSSEEDSEDSDDDSDDDGAGPSRPQQQELSREERRQAKKAQKEAAIARKKKGAVQVGDLPTDSGEGESDDDSDDDDDLPANPNLTKAARNQARAPPRGSSDKGVDEATEGVKKLSTTAPANMSRRERESMEAQQAKERYRKLHEAGKTDEAKADLARLRLIREKREAEAARKAVGY